MDLAMSGTGGRSGARWWIVGAIVVAAAASALDPSGLRKYRRLEAEVRRMEAENTRLVSTNGSLAREARALKSDPAALERAAREELRFVRPGERVYWLRDGAGAAP